MVGPSLALLELEQDPVLAILVSSWDFSGGRVFQQQVLARFGSPVHHPCSSPEGSFFLLVVFKRFTFRLTDSSVSLALQACLGGAPTGFHVQFQRDRHFRVSVACKDVGFFICSQRRFVSSAFDLSFHLWRDGGANWPIEHARWIEDLASWSRPHRHKPRLPLQSKPRRRVSFSGSTSIVHFRLGDPPAACFSKSCHAISSSRGRSPSSFLVGSITVPIPGRPLSRRSLLLARQRLPSLLGCSPSEASIRRDPRGPTMSCLVLDHPARVFATVPHHIPFP
ncbi:hypothetical protein GUJ93_ZPchr0015g6794 [Zizania palustris]|uniref:Uncharacterized protein n=1 Tax=Zizania palustris TaxID=103762 RepID=A0A8J5VSX1_ZIZPA|nr:hypothetical protein GUJ93_ZPchr0015g6794 [Zizania palustris]